MKDYDDILNKISSSDLVLVKSSVAGSKNALILLKFAEGEKCINVIMMYAGR
jgi:hypothetical protein